MSSEKFSKCTWDLSISLCSMPLYKWAFKNLIIYFDFKNFKKSLGNPPGAELPENGIDRSYELLSTRNVAKY